MKKCLCSYLPSSFPESCCWKGHKSSAALKQCCYLNIQNKTQLVSCYWKEESTAAKKKKKAFKLSVRLYLAGEVACARRNSSQKGVQPTAGIYLAWGRKDGTFWCFSTLDDVQSGAHPNQHPSALDPGMLGHGSILGDTAGWDLPRAHREPCLPPAVGFSLTLAPRTLLQTQQTSKVTALKSSCKVLLALLCCDLSSCQSETRKHKRNKPVRSLSLRGHFWKMVSL